MVLLALTMLFLVLMVTMTLGLGLRIRQKQELQHLADVAAYSNAVMTARAFNNMALVNRLQVSYWVALAADQSLISWTSYAQAYGAAVEDAAASLANGACAMTANERAQLGSFRAEVGAFLNQHFGGSRQELWRQLDRAAGRESKDIQSNIGGLRDQLTQGIVSANPGNLRDRLYTRLAAQQLTTQILALAGQSDVSILDVGAGPQPNTAAQVSLREVNCDYVPSTDDPLGYLPPQGSGLCLRRSMSTLMEHAAMGTRGHTFITLRTLMPPLVTGRIAAIASNYGSVTVISGGKSGSAYWAARKTHGTATVGTEAWGDDHGAVTVRAGRCASTMSVLAHVRSTHFLDSADEHVWSPRWRGTAIGTLEPEPDQDHTMGDCTPSCPSVWVRSVGFQPSNRADDAWGQPKTMVALERDLAARTFPWELHFSFPFSATGPAAQWDGRGHRIIAGAGSGLSIRRQTAISTGITYYHRREHWDEFPNLLNPFWRATLAAQDIDASGPTDVRRILSAPGHQWQRDAWQALRANGFEGLH
jgi:hypothetical protein